MPEPEPTPVPPTPPEPTPGPFNWRRFLPTNWQSIIGTAVLNIVVVLLAMIGIKSPIEPPPIPVPIFPEDWAVVPSEDGKTVKGFPTGWQEPRPEDKKAALDAGIPLWQDTDAGKLVVSDADGNAFLWKAAIKVRGKHIPTRNQGSVGSCVGFGFTCAAEYAIVTQAAEKIGPAIDGTIDIAQEATYAFSRVEVNGGVAPLIGDGSLGSWAAQGVTKFGLLPRGKYGDLDLTSYSTTRCRAWGRAGVPNDLEPLAKKNLVGSAALVKTAAEAKAALLQGYPIAVCSNVGFAGQSKRDADGFLRASGRWGHCMCLIGFRKDREAFYCMNSWGEDWVAGPLGAGDPPPGGFWIESKTVDRMLGQEDSYAISNVKGFPRRKINHDDWLAGDIMPHDRNANRDLKKAFGGLLYATAP